MYAKGYVVVGIVVAGTVKVEKCRTLPCCREAMVNVLISRIEVIKKT